MIVTITRLARGDTSLRVEWLGPDRLAVFRDDGTRHRITTLLGVVNVDVTQPAPAPGPAR